MVRPGGVAIDGLARRPWHRIPARPSTRSIWSRLFWPYLVVFVVGLYGQPLLRAIRMASGSLPRRASAAAIGWGIAWILVADPARHVDEIVKLLGLVDRREDLPVTMSRGWRQRTALACAMARGAPVLCVDEPFVGLDAAGREQLVVVLDWYRSAGRTVVVATHDAPSLHDLEPRVVRIGSDDD